MPNAYEHAEELYLVVYPQTSTPQPGAGPITLPSGYQPQCNPCFHPGLPPQFVYHDHVITGAPGIRKQLANDYLLSDWFVARGYAYASTDKGNDGVLFYRDGVIPGDAIAEWNDRITELTIAAKDVVRQRYGQLPAYTYITGLSNGGYLTRFALENHADLYDGGVDWEGTHWRPEGPNIFTFLPTALKYYPSYRLTATRSRTRR